MEKGKLVLDGVKNRNTGLDVTRILAYITVLSVHFFLNNEFYDTPMQGWRMNIMGAMRTLFMICVPLFMLLTGYLSAEKHIEVSKKGLLQYYSRLLPILLTYALADVLILLTRRFCLGENITWKDYFWNVLNYQQYSWYMNMYLGFALLIPFLNVLWRGLNSKQEQKMLVLVLIATTMLPTMLNAATRLIPDWWKGIYPITYYYIGAYLKKNVEIQKLPTVELVGLLLVSWTTFSALNVYVSRGQNFTWTYWGDEWGGIQNVLNTVLVFLIINSIHYPLMKQGTAKLLAYVSKITLPAYLLSWIPDRLNYPKLNAAVNPMPMRLKYFPLMVGSSIVVSLILAALVHECTQLILRGAGLLKKKLKKNESSI